MLKTVYFYLINDTENTNKDLCLKMCHPLVFLIISVTSSLLLLIESIWEDQAVITNKCRFFFISTYKVVRIHSSHI